MQTLPFHTSISCAAPGTPPAGNKLTLNQLLVKWLSDVDEGRFRYPHVVSANMVLTRIGWIWEHSLLEEWLLDASFPARGHLGFKAYLVSEGIASAATFEKTIDRVRYSGFKRIDRLAIISAGTMIEAKK